MCGEESLLLGTPHVRRAVEEAAMKKLSGEPLRRWKSVLSIKLAESLWRGSMSEGGGKRQKLL